MSREQMEQVLELIKALPDFSTASVDQLRENMEFTAKQMNLPPGSCQEEVDAGGVPALRVKAAGAPLDRLVIYHHGGGYIMGSPLSHRQLAAYLSKYAKAAVLMPDYRLAPENPFPSALEDAMAVYNWLLQKGHDPGKTALAGDSAGGGLTLALLQKIREDKLEMPKAAALISPWADLTCKSSSYLEKADADPLLKQDQCLRFAAMYLAGQDPVNPLVSPVFADFKGFCPLLVQTGSEEVLLDDSIRIEKNARAAKVACQLDIWEGMIHVWHSFAPVLQEGRDAIKAMGAFLDGHLRD